MSKTVVIDDLHHEQLLSLVESLRPQPTIGGMVEYLIELECERRGIAVQGPAKDDDSNTDLPPLLNPHTNNKEKKP